MAEKGSPTDEAASNTPTMAEIASGLMLGQSKSTGEQFLGFSELEQPRDGKNKMVLVCQQCRSRVLKPGYGTLVDKEVYNSTGVTKTVPTTAHRALLCQTTTISVFSKVKT